MRTIDDSDVKSDNWFTFVDEEFVGVSELYRCLRHFFLDSKAEGQSWSYSMRFRSLKAVGTLICMVAYSYGDYVFCIV